MNDIVYIIIGLLIILGFSISLNLIFLPFLRRLKFGQSIREEGPTKHLQKVGTPTMGGIPLFITFMMIFAIFLVILHIKKIEINYLRILITLIPIIGYTIIGFMDDALIIIKKNNQGLKPLTKLLGELLIALVFYIFYVVFMDTTTINFFGISWDLKWIYGFFIIIYFAAVTNATNITDGIDGLLSITSLCSFLAFFILAYFKKDFVIMALISAMMLAILSFMFLNLPKAKVFMGDTGSLLIGGSLAVIAIMLKYELLLVIIGIVYVIETISVILQVWYFKKTKGKRLLRMSPMHHHLELSGLSEIEIDIIFGFISLIFAILGIYLGVMLF